MALSFPRFSRGGFGRLKFSHLNDLFDAVEELLRRVMQSERDRRKRVRPFVGRVTARQNATNWPLATRLGWDQEQLVDPSDAPDFLVPFPPARTSDPLESGDPFAIPALDLAPPHGVFIPIFDNMGRRRYVWVSASQVIAVLLTNPQGFPGGTYTATSVDGAVVRTAVPAIDRWSGITYPTPSTHGFLLLVNDTLSQSRLYAFERPQINPCPGGAPLSAPSGFRKLGT